MAQTCLVINHKLIRTSIAQQRGNLNAKIAFTQIAQKVNKLIEQHFFIRNKIQKEMQNVSHLDAFLYR